jgi:phosphonopyruvate decarboxylase
MILAENLIKALKKNNIDFYTGVPDSILKKFSACLEKLPKKNHIISTNEGSSVATGIGYYLSTKKIACVYLQNSGLSNAINPLLSIASAGVYSIPLLLIIGWRGSPGMKDEPQHVAKGKITKKILKLLKIDFCILKKPNDLHKLKRLINNSYEKKKIVACLIEKGTLKSNIKLKKQKSQKNQILRSEFIKEFLKNIPKSSKIVSTTGYTSRELMQLRQVEKLYNGKDFYMVGGMGHSAMVALGYSLRSNREIFCLDGDGSILMHLGSLRTAGHNNRTKFKHILLNNGTHESVGGQSTTAAGIDFKNLIKSIGYKNYFQIKRKNKVKIELKRFIKSKGPSFLEVKIKNGSMKNLIRPKNLIYIKNKFMSK